MANDLPKTLIEAVRYFSDKEVCNELMTEIKWPKGIVCPKCEGKSVSPVKNRPKLQCNKCRCQFSYKVGTIFEDSPLGFDKWFPIIYAVANDIRVSSGRMAELLGTTQKTAWRMGRIIQLAMEAA